MNVEIVKSECSSIIEAGAGYPDGIMNFIMYHENTMKAISYTITTYEEYDENDDNDEKIYSMPDFLKLTGMKDDYVDIIFQKHVDSSMQIINHPVGRDYAEPNIVSGLYFTARCPNYDINEVVDTVKELIEDAQNMLWPSLLNIEINEVKFSFIDILEKTGRLEELKKCVKDQLEIGFE